ncbi:hypothetical protein DPEC_G00202360 [Dallia pectoralis]|uniref:Uncharacterized protein n=1 Tax=Dallia pectoralis TaxID=75939 RepID=A0ACC2G990_DALPE|nr:hypothetical protein DPEC_G00202360 [Dallia pectoralis]
MHASKAGVSMRTIVLTPERIPIFTIPSKQRSLHAQRDFETERSTLLSRCSPNQRAQWSPESRTTSSLFLRPPSTPVTTCTAHPRTTPQREDWSDPSTPQREDWSDPTTRAAMSLSHVDKITTPYGFRALSQSPCTRRRESLFHKDRKTRGSSLGLAGGMTYCSPMTRPSTPCAGPRNKRRTTGPVPDEEHPAPCSMSTRKTNSLQEFFTKPIAALKASMPARLRRWHQAKASGKRCGAALE